MNRLDSIPQTDYGRFKQFLEKACGIILGEGKQYLITSRLTGILRKNDIADLNELLNRIEGRTSLPLYHETIDAMTTNETSWFRDQNPFLVLENEVFAKMDKEGKHNCRIWSSACSSGQEPYTISITFSEYLKSRTTSKLKQLQILATDISTSVLSEAKKAEYEASILGRGLSSERRDAFFKPHEDRWVVRDEIKNRVSFKEQNLLTSYSSLGQFDVIFCRNVLIYFSAERKSEILNRMADSLSPGGYLFLGASETIAGYCDRFEMQRTSYGVLYKLKP
jgi:chemotaxis protein methyltransferase CheR